MRCASETKRFEKTTMAPRQRLTGARVADCAAARPADSIEETESKEAKETKFWLRMIVKAVPKLREKAIPLWQEAKELLLIFAAIHRKR